MKTLLLFISNCTRPWILLMLLSTTSIAGNVSISAYVPEQSENIPTAAREMLLNKMNQLITQNGISNGPLGSRFIITPNVMVMTKDILPGPPPMTAMNLTITFYIGDGIDGRKFASKAIDVKGVGINETKAYIDCFKNIRAEDQRLVGFLEDAKAKIIDYYNTNCDVIIKNALAASAQGNHEEAIAQLTTIPEACSACYDKGMKAAEPIYKKYIDQQCNKKLQEARGYWNANQNGTGAGQAGAVLSEIEPTASCYPEATALHKEISARMVQLGDKTFEYKMKELEVAGEVAKAKVTAYASIVSAYYLSKTNIIVYRTAGWW